MFEYEEKYLLTENEYEILYLTADNFEEQFVQKNYYYDTDCLKFNKTGITLRIREKNGKYEATVKSHSPNVENCSTEKTKKAVNSLDADAFGIEGLRLYGVLTTLRTIIYRDSNIEIALDKNTYSGHTDYELEIEYTEGHYEYVSKFMFAYNELLKNKLLKAETSLSKRSQTNKSKSSRFFAYKTKNEVMI